MKRFISLILSTLLVFGVLPLGAVADGTEYEQIFLTLEGEYPSEAELFEGFVEQSFIPESAVSVWGVSAREKLSDTAKYYYDWLKSCIEKVAAGTTTSTTFTATTSTFSSWTGITNTFQKTDSEAFAKFMAQFEYQKVTDALLNDCPYDLYWFDKTTSVMMGGASSTLGSTKSIVQLDVVFQVCESYRAANYNSEKPAVSAVSSTVKSAAANAKSIVEENASLSDYNKLVAYRDTICAWVDYNYDALEDGVLYGNPWQLIHVFDGDSTTKVVCEGYSKAFKYLCDMTDFDSDLIICASVTGKTNGGGHMWNIVSMPDGKNYLVDVTNSDSGTIGQDGKLFLKGMSGSIADGYTKQLSSKITYVYESDMLELWGTDEESMLYLSSTDYTPPQLHLSVNASSYTYDASSVTIGASGADITYSAKQGESLSGANISYEWYKDNNGAVGASIAGAPTDVGTYWVKVVASAYGERFSATAKFSITPAILSVTSANCANKTYDGTKNATVVNVSLDGRISGDDVRVAIESAEFESASAGKKTKVTIKDIILLGDDKDNYQLSASQYTLTIPEATVEKADGAAIDSTIDGNYDVSKNNPNTFTFTVKAVEGAEYKMDEGDWQDSNVFDLIAPNSGHSFYIRYKETENYNPGVSQQLSLVLNKLANDRVPVINVTVSGNTGDRTVTIGAVDGAEYSFDGVNWSDNNVLTGVSQQTVKCYIRYKETAVCLASAAANKTVDTVKISAPAPSAFELSFVSNSDGSYTAVIPKIENGLYSFDGVTWSSNNTLSGCVAGGEYIGYVKVAETADFGESPITSAIGVAPAPVVEPDPDPTPDHTHSAVGGWASDTDNHWKECSCGEDLNKAPHVAGDWVVVTPATEGRAGKEVKKCTVCEYILETKEIPALEEEKPTPEPDPEPEPELMLGDVNKSGEIDSMDYVLVKRAYFGTFEFNEDQFSRGDVNKSGDIDSMDYVLVKRAYFGTFQIK